MRKIILFSLLFSLQVCALNVQLDESSVANGKSVLLELDDLKESSNTKVEFLGKKYKVYNHPSKKNSYYTLIPVSYYEKNKKEKVYIHYRDESKQKSTHLNLSVISGDYKKETLKVSKSKVSLNKEDKKRASKEYKEAMDIYNSVSKNSYISSEFILPLESKITSDFGKARVYNDTLNGYHSGTDFRAKVGIPIKASNDGIVVLAKDRFYSGGSIVIDHGHGIYTCYFHMSKFDVKKGQKIKKAQIIGLSGDSGRVTGPHLHFSARVRGVQVDPLQLISLINNKLF